MKDDDVDLDDELRPEYDLDKLRLRRMGPGRKQFGNYVKLEPDVAAIFPDAASVNAALRMLIRVTQKSQQEPVEMATAQ